ncbi:MAG TPA: hypothetical protein PK867_03875 [Pirellulales bacterium]|nr:hypothetical protein [Pirellulales bacterium]
MKRLFRRSLRRSGKKGHRQTLGRSAPRSGVFRAIGSEQLEGRIMLTAQLVVNTTADDIDGGTVADPSGPDGTLSLREAITVANLDGGANISINIPGDSVQNPQTIGLTSALPALGNGITISGPGAGELTVSGRNQFQVFDVSGGATVAISGLTIAQGFALSGGGGILNEGTLALANDVLTNNSASAPSGGFAGGGAIYNDGTLTITTCSLTNNSATATGNGSNVVGGAIFNQSANNSATLTITNSTLSGNSISDDAGEADGGAIENDGNATITGTSITGNTATPRSRIAR